MTEYNLSPEQITQNLNTRFIGQKIIYFPKLESTMDAARREALWGTEAGTVIITEEQTAGRGRFQRNWISPQSGLAFSVILRPNIDKLPYMIMLASLAVVYGIRSVTGLKANIKWPNDVLIKDKKVCGILIENDIRQNNLVYTVIGIGINVNLNIQDYPDISPFATSLFKELGKEISRSEVLRQVLIEMDRLYETIHQGDTILEQWKRQLSTLGQKVQVCMGERIYRGKAESVTSDGSLILRQDNGELIKVIAGEITS